MGFLLDTNVVAEMMRTNPEPRVTAFLGTISPQGVGLSSITAWEILSGIGRLAPGRRREDLGFRFRSMLDDVFEGRVFDWTIADARACTQVMERKRRLGEPLDDHIPDAIVAGTALCHGLAVVTRNEKEFRNTGVDVVNPWRAASTIQRRPFEAPGGHLGA